MLLQIASARLPRRSTGMSKPLCCDEVGIAHDWDEQYYGYKCRLCQLFIPYGCEPWIDDWNEESADA